MNKLLISLLLLSLFGCGDGATKIGNTNNPLVVEEEVTPDPEPNPDPQPAPEVEVILQEMSAGFCSIDGVVESTNAGFTGDGYANTNNEIGSTIGWQINAQTAGSYSAVIRYASPSDRPVTISSNNVDTTVEMNSSGDFTSWIKVATDIPLAAGNNDIVLTATTAEGAANIDSITITGVGLVAGTCMYTAPKAATRAYVIGDSTAANYGSGDYPQKGWGQILQNFFDDSEIEVVNKASGGRSSRNFYNEAGLWDEVLADIEAGDYLLIQFGHNDRDTTAERYTSTTDYESYLAKFVNEAKAKDAIPVLISPMVINAYNNGVLRNVFTESSNDYAGSTAKVAADLGVAYVDLNAKSYDLVNTLGEQKASRYLFLNLYPGEYSNYSDGEADNTHFQELGAVEMSRLIVEGMEELNTRDDMATLLEHTKHRYPLIVEEEGANDSIITQGNAYPEGTPLTLKTIAGTNDTFNAWYSLGENVSDTNIYQITMPASRHTLVAAFNGAVPVVNLDAATVFIIGDSTVANYATSYYPQTGWGQVLQPFFDDTKITIDNRAIGGTSSKSFYNSQWDTVKASITAGDFVFIQFGINDRASDDPDRYAPTGGVFEGFITNFVNETIALGATPVLVSSVRRNQWDNGVPYDAYHQHPVVTRELAADLGVALIDLDAKNKALLESVGEDYANKFYYMGFGADEYPIYINGKSGLDANGNGKEDTVHFQEAGAVEIARLVREGISELSTNQALAPLVLALKPLYPVTVASPTAGVGMFTQAYSYPENTPLTLKALPSAGNVFTQWLDNNNAELSTSSIYQLLSEDVAAEYTAVFNNSEGLGTPTSNLKMELQGTNVQLTWDIRNYNDPITNLDLYRMEEIPQDSAPANKQVQRVDSPLPNNSVLLLANAPQTGSFIDETGESGKTYTYFFRVTQGDNVTDAIEPDSEIRVPYVNEIPVTNLVGTVDGTAINLSWDLKYFNPDITYLEIYRNTINGTSDRVRVSSSAPLAGSLRDEGLEPGTTYWYMFKMTQDGEFNNTDPEGEILIPIDAVPTVDPNAPTEPEETNLTTLVNGTDILVSWDLQNFYPEITSLELYRNDKKQAEGRTRILPSATLSGTYLDENLELGKTYWYMFKLTKDGVTSSTDPEAETLIPIDALPAPKTNLTAVVNGTDIDLTWDLQNFYPAITSLEVYRNDINDTSGRTRVVKGAALQGSFTDKGLDLDSDGNVVGTGLVPGTTYWYMFKITQSTGTTNTIPDAEVTVPLGATPSGPTTNLVATANGLGVDLSWDLQNFDPEVTYLEVYRNDKNETSGRTRVVKGAAITGTFRDEGFDLDGNGDVVGTGLEAGKTYWYMFKITQSTGTTSPDPEASVTLDADPSVPPAQPATNLVATANGLTVDLSWDLQNFDPDVTSLEVYRNDKNDTSGRVRIIKGAPLSGSFNDKGLEDETTAGAGNAGTGLVAGKTYWYMFKITQSTGTTSPDPEASVTLDADPSVPPAQPATNLVATANGLTVDLSWDLQNFDPEVTYLEVYRNDKNDTAGRVRIIKGAPLSGSFNDKGLEDETTAGAGNAGTGLEAGKTYWYMFKITQSTGTTSPDPEAEVTIPAS